MNERRSFRIDDLASRVSGDMTGEGAVEVCGLAALHDAGPTDLTFITRDAFVGAWGESKACGAVVSHKLLGAMDSSDSRPLIVVPSADHAMAVLLSVFAWPEPAVDAGIHPGALVDSSAQVDPTASIASGVTIGPETKIGARTRLGPGVHIGHACVIGADCHFRAGVVIEHHVLIGARVSIHPNAVIGADGFGYVPTPTGELLKVPHIGTVEIHDDVEIGAAATVDRGKFGCTTIGAGTKIDNTVQVAHNVQIGKNCVIAAQAAIAGSTTLGEWCQIGGQTGIADHIRIGDRVRIAALSGVFRDIESDSEVGGTPAVPLRDFWRMYSALRKLPALLRSQKDRPL